MAQLNFDASQVAPSVAPEAKPAGWYPCMMTASEMKPTKNNDGMFLECEFTILAPPEYAGQKFFDRLNLQNNNPQAVEIAFKTLSAICHATGVIQVADSAVLHNRPLQLKVNLRQAGVGADGKQHEATNEVKGYKALDGAVPQAVAHAPVIPPAPPPAYAAPAYAPPPAAAVAAAPAWAPPAAPAPFIAPPAPTPVYAAPPAAAPAAPPPAAPVAPAPPPAAAVAPVTLPPVTPVSGAPVPPWLQPKQ